jgi:hypothetical protein
MTSHKAIRKVPSATLPNVTRKVGTASAFPTTTDFAATILFFVKGMSMIDVNEPERDYAGRWEKIVLTATPYDDKAVNPQNTSQICESTSSRRSCVAG